MLEVRDLTKIYPGPLKAVDGVDLDIPLGMFGLLGPNGAGKTTLMRMVAGLLEPTAGSLRFDGEDMLARPERIWQRLGYLPQEFGFYPHLSGRQMLDYLLRLKGVGGPRRQRADRTARLLEAVHLTEAAERKVSSYSGGMRQRLGVAQAIAGDPRLIIVDEPTAGLDPEERHRFYRLLAELALDRVVVLSTHIVEDVAVLCPQFAILRAGRVTARQTPTQARRELTGRIYEASVERSDLAGVLQSHRVTQNILTEGRHRVRIYEPEGGQPEGFEVVEPSLEDAYLVAMHSDPDAEGGWQVAA